MGQNLAGDPVISYPYTDIAQPELVEVIDTQGQNYTPVAAGTAYPDATKYPNHVLMFQDAIDQRWLRRTYLNITAVGWGEVESMGVNYPEIFIGYVIIDELGSAWNFVGRRARSVAAQVLYTFTIGVEGTAPASPVLPNGKTVINPQVLWNPATQSWRLWGGFSATDVITDAFTYSGTFNGVSFSFAVAASNPTATQYAAYVAAGDHVLYQQESKRYKENIFANRFLYIPVL